MLLTKLLQVNLSSILPPVKELACAIPQAPLSSRQGLGQCFLRREAAIGCGGETVTACKSAWLLHCRWTGRQTSMRATPAVTPFVSLQLRQLPMHPGMGQRYSLLAVLTAVAGPSTSELRMPQRRFVVKSCKVLLHVSGITLAKTAMGY